MGGDRYGQVSVLAAIGGVMAIHANFGGDNADQMQAFGDLPYWHDGMSRLRQLMETNGAAAREAAGGYAATYSGRRAAMVVDVVASRQRRYETRVMKMVASFEERGEVQTLADLAAKGPGEGLGLRPAEPETIRKVAAGLLRYMEQHDLDEEAGVVQWANQCQAFEHAPGLEPFVGSTKGIGPALFAYLRMRCGADAIKPDLRVRNSLRSLGFAIPGDEHSILLVASAAASELGVSRLVLDQLLWAAS